MYGTTTPLTGGNEEALLERNVLNTTPGRVDRDPKTVFLMETQHRAASQELDDLVAEFGAGHWKVRTFQRLHSSRAILSLAVLMLGDVLALIIGLILESAYPECASIIHRVECNNKDAPCIFILTDQGEQMKCGGEKTCVDTPESVETTKMILTLLSLCILFLFLCELSVHLVVLGGKRSLSNVFLMFDLFIVVISLWLEGMTTIHEQRREQGDEVQFITVPLLLASRSWRLLRIGHGTYKEAHDLYEQRLDTLMRENDELRKRLAGHM
jgi:hypothetical protein